MPSGRPAPGVREPEFVVHCDLRGALRPGDARYCMRCDRSLAAAPIVAGGRGAVPDRRRHAPAEAAYLRKLREQLPLGAYVAALRPEPHLLYVTPYVVETLGLLPEALTTDPTNWSRLVHPDGRARVVAAADALVRSGEPLRVVCRVVCPDGRERWWEAHAVVIEDQQGHSAYVVGFCQDVTDREMAVRAVRESEARYRELVETTTDVIYTVSPLGIITSLNSAFEAMTGWPRQEWLGKSVAPLIHPFDLPRATSCIARDRRRYVVVHRAAHARPLGRLPDWRVRVHAAGA